MADPHRTIDDPAAPKGFRRRLSMAAAMSVLLHLMLAGGLATTRLGDFSATPSSSAPSVAVLKPKVVADFPLEVSQSAAQKPAHEKSLDLLVDKNMAKPHATKHAPPDQNRNVSKQAGAEMGEKIAASSRPLPRTTAPREASLEEAARVARQQAARVAEATATADLSAIKPAAAAAAAAAAKPAAARTRQKDPPTKEPAATASRQPAEVALLGKTLPLPNRRAQRPTGSLAPVATSAGSQSPDRKQVVSKSGATDSAPVAAIGAGLAPPKISEGKQPQTPIQPQTRAAQSPAAAQPATRLRKATSLDTGDPATPDDSTMASTSRQQSIQPQIRRPDGERADTPRLQTASNAPVGRQGIAGESAEAHETETHPVAALPEPDAAAGQSSRADASGGPVQPASRAASPGRTGTTATQSVSSSNTTGGALANSDFADGQVVGIATGKPVATGLARGGAARDTSADGTADAGPPASDNASRANRLSPIGSGDANAAGQAAESVGVVEALPPGPSGSLPGDVAFDAGPPMTAPQPGLRRRPSADAEALAVRGNRGAVKVPVGSRTAGDSEEEELSSDELPTGIGPQAGQSLRGARRNATDAIAGEGLAMEAGPLPRVAAVVLPAEGRVREIAKPFAQRTKDNRELSAQEKSLAPNRRELLEKSRSEAEATVERGLVFLARAQQSDGRWSLGRFPGATKEDGGKLQSDTAATGLALLSFFGAGYDHFEGKHRDTVRRGIEFLLSTQKPDGDLYISADPLSNSCAWLYSHGMATMALCEAVGMTGDEIVRPAAERACDFIATSQHPERGGWRYTPRSDADLSVSGWMLVALRAGQLAKLSTDAETFNRVRTLLDASTTDKPSAPYFYNARNPQQRPSPSSSACMTAVGTLMRLHTGWSKTDPRVIEAGHLLAATLPSFGSPAASTSQQKTRDCYLWYYVSQVLVHTGGEGWEEWYRTLSGLLASSQAQTGAQAGSWDPLGATPDRWGAYGGRLYVTTLHLLTLEVPYRHLPTYKVGD